MNKHIPLPIKNILIMVLAITAIIGCGNSSAEKNLPVERDTTITKTSAYSSLDLDSALLESYISNTELKSSMAEKMRNFYKSRNYHFAWFSPEGLTEQARAFYNLHNTY